MIETIQNTTGTNQVAFTPVSITPEKQFFRAAEGYPLLQIDWGGDPSPSSHMTQITIARLALLTFFSPMPATGFVQI